MYLSKNVRFFWSEKLIYQANFFKNLCKLLWKKKTNSNVYKKNSSLGGCVFSLFYCQWPKIHLYIYIIFCFMQLLFTYHHHHQGALCESYGFLFSLTQSVPPRNVCSSLIYHCHKSYLQKRSVNDFILLITLKWHNLKFYHKLNILNEKIK